MLPGALHERARATEILHQATGVLARETPHSRVAPFSSPRARAASDCECAGAQTALRLSRERSEQDVPEREAQRRHTCHDTPTDLPPLAANERLTPP